MDKRSNSFLIVGANFENKGAQSMLFITISEIKKRNPDAVVYYAGVDTLDSDLYKFEQVFYSEPAKYIAFGGIRAVKNSVYCIGKDCVKTVLGKRNNLWRMFELSRILPSIDLMIDISGFNLGEKWSEAIQISYLNNIRLAKKYHIPIILMPQSFGPFNYSEGKRYLLKEIAECLSYPDVIYVREKEGYRALTDTFQLTNVKQSPDLVLQSKGLDWNNIYSKSINYSLPKIRQEAVAIIPNNQCFMHGDATKILHYYNVIINELLSCGKQIYIFRHSKEDLQHCKIIYDMYKDNSCVHLLENDFSCIEYSELVKKFQFVVCSRFHGIVHAYRNAVPCIVLGWAVKYKELCDCLGQSKYIFDITSDNIEDSQLKNVADDMSLNFEYETKIIARSVAEIQQESCFDILDCYIQ